MRHTLLAILVALPALGAAQGTVPLDSPEGRVMIAAAQYAAGDCLAAPSGGALPETGSLSVACEGPEATHRIESVVIDPDDCPDGADRLSEDGAEAGAGPTFCLIGTGR
jgi:hypothetical protein